MRVQYYYWPYCTIAQAERPVFILIKGLRAFEANVHLAENPSNRVRYSTRPFIRVIGKYALVSRLAGAHQHEHWFQIRVPGLNWPPSPRARSEHQQTILVLS